MGTRRTDYTDEQREGMALLVSSAMKEQSLSLKQAEARLDVADWSIRDLSRTMPSGMAAGLWLKICLGLDLDIYHVAHILGLDQQVLRNIEHGMAYPNYEHHTELCDPLDQVLQAVPEKRREKAKHLIENILEVMQ